MGIIPAWARTLGAIIDNKTQIRARCTRCPALKFFTIEEIEALAEKVGRDYSLVNRRCRCRLTEGCPGWNKFGYLHGVYRQLVDDWERNDSLWD